MTIEARASMGIALAILTTWSFLISGSGESARAASVDQQPARDTAEDELGALKRMIEVGHYDEAEKKAREIVGRVPVGPDRESPKVAEALRYLVDALLRQAKEKDPETGRLAEESVALSGRVFGESDPAYAASLANLGTYCLRTDNFDRARELLHRSLDIYSQARGPASAEAALTMSRLASVEGITGHFVEAGSLMEQAVAIADSLPVIDTPDFGSIFHNYGTYLDNAGDILGAERVDLRALEIRQRLLPTPHPQIAYSLMALGSLREKLGDYPSARALLEKALAMTEETVGPNHRQVGQIVADLAILYADTGRPDLAIPYQERAVSITRATRGDDSSDYWQTVSELGSFRARAGDWNGALDLLRPALAGQEKKFGPLHQEVGVTVLILAEVESEAGDAKSAAEHYQRGIEIFEKMFGPNHPEAAIGLVGLARLKLAAGALDEADALFRQALGMRESILGADHPGVAEVLVDLARLDWIRGDGPGALRESFRAEGILRDHFGQVIRGFSQREALAYQRIRATGLGVACSVVAGTRPQDRAADAVRQVWDAVIGSRSMVLDQVASRHEFAEDHSGGKAAELNRNLAAAANRLAKVVVQGPDLAHPQTYRAQFEKALAEKEKLEHELAALANGPNGFGAPSSASLEEIRKALPPASGLVAFVAFPKSPGRGASPPPASRAPGQGESNEYGALVLRAGDSAPSFWDLGSAATIDALVSLWRQETAPPSSGSPAGDPQAEKRYRQAGSKLRERVWDPLAAKLAGLKQVLIVPDGSIALVSFAALPSGTDRYLLETSPVPHYLSTERDILKASETRTEITRALVMGAPDFDAAPPAVAASLDAPSPLVTAEAPPTMNDPTFRGVAPGCQDFQGLRFGALPGAGNEVAQVESQLPASATVADFTGTRASEPSFKRWAPGSSLIHLATHGFFLGAACRNPIQEGSGLGAVRGEISLGNPLLLSGLALAGANHRAQAGSEADDGVLTSEEIAAMDLSSARWVVLSACETGIGAIQSGEGVLGLRRAFRLAGAQTIIMSLWKVEDRATLEWMRDLYDGRGHGLSTAKAVQKASLDALKERRAEGRSTHPFYWGAFVAAGDWR